MRPLSTILCCPSSTYLETGQVIERLNISLSTKLAASMDQVVILLDIPDQRPANNYKVFKIYYTITSLSQYVSIYWLKISIGKV